MTILKCSAMTCVYNKEQLCSKGDIDVTGENATAATKSRSTAKPITVPIMITANVQHPPFR